MGCTARETALARGSNEQGQTEDHQADRGRLVDKFSVNSHRRTERAEHQAGNGKSHGHADAHQQRRGAVALHRSSHHDG
jgi:hypothetical protein